MASKEFLAKAYLAYFGRPVDKSGEISFAGTSEADVIKAFSTSAESAALYGANSGLEKINAYYLTVFGRPAELAGAQGWLLAVEKGQYTIESVAVAIINAGLLTADKVAIENKLAASALFTASLDTMAEALAYNGNAAAATARDFLSSVKATAATQAQVDAVISATMNAVVVGQSMNLSVTADNLTGTTGNDTFVARVVQNADGHQTNQLGTGDKISGGAGLDTLNATVQMAAALGSNFMPQQAITPETVGVEQAYFTALSVSNAGMFGPFASSSNLLDEAETTVINAKSMLGLTEIGSVQSDASVFIENLTTLTDTGVYADRRNTEAVAVRMDHTGNDRAADAESNLTVLFDNDYLLAGKATSDKAYYFLEDREGAAANAAKPLNRINTDGLKFTVDGVAKVIGLTAAQMATFQANDGTWAGYTALMKAALATAAETDASLKGLSLELSTTVFRTLGLDGTTLPLPAPAIVLSSTSSVIESTGFRNQADAPGQYDVFAVIENNPQAVQGLPITVNVELYKVGRGAEGGALTIGGMSTDLANVWDYSASAKAEGVEKFVITVEGDATQDSSLSTVRSTNNTLNTVIVKNVAGSAADLYIGNHNTDSSNLSGGTNNGATFTIDDYSKSMKDVKTFDSSAFVNDMNLYAGFTSEMSAKYGLVDTAVTYTTGVGNDKINLAIGESTSQQVDYVVATGEGNDTIKIEVDGDAVDAVTESLSINAGNGNNTVSVTISDVPTFSPTTTPIPRDVYGALGVDFATSNLLKNLKVVTGTGTDKVTIAGVGNFNIATGAGNDMVFINAGGDMAAGNLWNPDSSTPLAIPEIAKGIALFGAKLSIRVAGFESTVSIETGPDFIATTQDINNAIIAAIAANPEVARLVSASIGTTDQDLIVKSLVDGDNQAELIMFQPDLIATGTAQGSEVLLSSANVATLAKALITTGRALDSAEIEGRVPAEPAGISAGDVAAYFNDTASATVNAAGVNGPFTVAANTDGVNGTYWYAASNAGGSEGSVENNSVINMSTGANDLVVLSSNDDSSNTLVFNAAWDKVSVVNFFENDNAIANGGVALDLTGLEPGAAMINGLHKLNFTTFLTNTVSSSGSSLSELPIKITVLDATDDVLFNALSTPEFTANNIVFANVDDLETSMATSTNLSFAGLTAAQVQAALNAVGGFDAATQFQAVGSVPNNVVQTSRTSLLFVENVDTMTNPGVTAEAGTSLVGFEEIIAGVANTSYANYGDYKVYQVTYSDVATDAVVAGTDAGFTVTLIGQLDFGNSLNTGTLQSNLVNGAAYLPTP